MSESPKKAVGRMARTVRSLVAMALLGVGLTLYSHYSNSRDVRMATGAEGIEQRQFFDDASERPDMEVFFRSLEPGQRLAMSRNIGKYDDPAMAKLIGKCLGTFDTEARKALTESLKKLAVTQPKSIAEQLSLAGSFQQLAIATALQSAGPNALPMVAERITNADARPNAVAYLVAAGAPSGSVISAYLENKDKDVRLAAADVLGKIRDRSAVEKLTQMYGSAEGDEKFGYLAALAGIGDPVSERLLTSAIGNESYPVSERAQASIGLGRIGTTSAIATLWLYPSSEQPQLSESAVTALQVAGDASLSGEYPVPQKLRVAAGIESPLADRVIAGGLADHADRLKAAASASNRESVVPQLLSALGQVSPDREGDVADEVIRALASTPLGLRALARVQNPALKGLVDRRLKLERLDSALG